MCGFICVSSYFINLCRKLLDATPVLTDQKPSVSKSGRKIKGRGTIVCDFLFSFLSPWVFSLTLNFEFPLRICVMLLLLLMCCRFKLRSWKYCLLSTSFYNTFSPSLLLMSIIVWENKCILTHSRVVSNIRKLQTRENYLFLKAEINSAKIHARWATRSEAMRSDTSLHSHPLGFPHCICETLGLE